MAKIRCNICMNEEKNFCKIKKSTINPNKPRRCEAYIYDEGKVKGREEIPSIRFGYKDQQEARRRRKAEIVALKEDAKKSATFVSPIPIPNTNEKHPLTGDLSRFTTTANKDKE